MKANYETKEEGEIGRKGGNVKEDWNKKREKWTWPKYETKEGEMEKKGRKKEYERNVD